jgi:hypothetical protein
MNIKMTKSYKSNSFWIRNISNHFFYSVRFSPGQIKIVWGNTDRQTFAKYYENSEQKIISYFKYILLNFPHIKVQQKWLQAHTYIPDTQSFMPNVSSNFSAKLTQTLRSRMSFRKLMKLIT